MDPLRRPPLRVEPARAGGAVQLVRGFGADLSSIKALLETAKGNPYPNDIRITVKAH